MLFIFNHYGLLNIRILHRQRDGKYRSATRIILGLDRSVMGIHNLLHHVESEILLFITKEGIEHMFLVFIGNANAIVSQQQDDTLPRRLQHRQLNLTG